MRKLTQYGRTEVRLQVKTCATRLRHGFPEEDVETPDGVN